MDTRTSNLNSDQRRTGPLALVRYKVQMRQPTVRYGDPYPPAMWPWYRYGTNIYPLTWIVAVRVRVDECGISAPPRALFISGMVR
eukprot:scaffold184921_cov19-Prasinocladus_malaysianus.AAC.1